MRQVIHKGQHLLRHKAEEVGYLNATLGASIKTVKDALDLFATLNINFSWKDPVATKAALPLTGNTLSDARMVQDDGDGNTSLYVCIATSGDVDAQWQKIADVDWEGDISQLQSDVSTLQGEMTAVEGDVFTLQGEMAAVEIDVFGLQNAVSILQGEMTDVQEEVIDKMTLTINDDLSGLLYLRVGVGSKIENRTTK